MTRSGQLDRFSVVFPTRRVELGTRTKDPNKVETTSVEYDRMWVDWELIEDLCEGRDQMIIKERRWLPQEPAEEFASYLVRLNRTVLFGGFADTLEKLSSKPFTKEVTIKNEDLLPQGLEGILQDVDGEGTALTPFSKAIFKSGMKYGHTFVFVDFPAVDRNLTDQPLSVLEEQRSGVRPYFIHVEAPNVIGWRRRRTRDGTTAVSQIRYRETVIEPDGQFGDQQREFIRVWNAPALSADEVTELRASGVDVPVELTQGTVESWRKNDDDDEFEFQSVRRHTYPGIPMQWLPFDKTGFLTSKPPLKELAEQNLAHWQTSSDERNILRFVSIATLFLKGVEDEAQEDETGESSVVIGPSQLISTPNTNADGKYIEHSGQGVQSLSTHIATIQERMEMLGMQPLMARQQDVTAAATKRDDAKTSSAIQSWIRSTEMVLLKALEIAATWIGQQEQFKTATEADDALGVDIFNDFNLATRGRDDISDLLAARAAGEITRKTFLNEVKIRGLLSEDVSVDDEIRGLIEEALAFQPGVDDDPDNDPENDDDPENENVDPEDENVDSGGSNSEAA